MIAQDTEFRRYLIAGEETVGDGDIAIIESDDTDTFGGSIVSENAVIDLKRAVDFEKHAIPGAEQVAIGKFEIVEMYRAGGTVTSDREHGAIGGEYWPNMYVTLVERCFVTFEPTIKACALSQIETTLNVVSTFFNPRFGVDF